MKLDDFDYYLPPERIAQAPVKPRDTARLLVVAKKANKFRHDVFKNLTSYLKSGDLLVLNDSKVIPARLIGKKVSGGRVEILLLNKFRTKVWRVIGKNIPAKGEKIIFAKKFEALVVKNQAGIAELSFNCQGNIFWKKLNYYGQVPLPPYIKSAGKNLDSERYQTVYADKRDHGSVAAPTAGLHFTPRLLKQIKKYGIKVVKVTLHVGLGTFRPITETDITKHKMHEEWISVSPKVVKEILKTKQAGGRVIAIGTTSVRALETAIRKSQVKTQGWSGETNIFIYPPFKFKLVDGLITNFHLPKSTLLLLVSALASRSKIMKAYQIAIKNNYRFYSYGDAMLIL